MTEEQVREIVREELQAQQAKPVGGLSPFKHRLKQVIEEHVAAVINDVDLSYPPSESHDKAERETDYQREQRRLIRRIVREEMGCSYVGP